MWRDMFLTLDVSAAAALLVIAGGCFYRAATLPK